MSDNTEDTVEKTIYDLGLHEKMSVSLGNHTGMEMFGFDSIDWEVTVLRVHNGWIYIGLDDGGPVFVPNS